MGYSDRERVARRAQQLTWGRGHAAARSLGGVDGWDCGLSVFDDKLPLSSDPRRSEPFTVPSLSKRSVRSSTVKSQGWSSSAR